MRILLALVLPVALIIAGDVSQEEQNRLWAEAMKRSQATPAKPAGVKSAEPTATAEDGDAIIARRQREEAERQSNAEMGRKAKQEEQAKSDQEKGRREMDERVRKAWVVPAGKPVGVPPAWTQGEWKRTMEDGRAVTLCVIGSKTLMWDVGNPIINITSVEEGSDWCAIATNLVADGQVRICVRKNGDAVQVGIVRNLDGKPALESPFTVTR